MGQKDRLISGPEVNFRAKKWDIASHEFQQQTITIEGGRPLAGAIEVVGGGKNTAGKHMLVACIFDTPSVIRNLQDIGEVAIVAEMLEELGATLRFAPDRRSVFIDPTNMQFSPISTGLGKASRISMVMAGMKLTKFGQADIPLPGGDKLGKRSVKGHIRGLESLGAQVISSDEERITFAAPRGLVGSEYTFKVPSYTGTENLLIASSRANGTTVLHNAALEPEADELISVMNRAGARIRRGQDIGATTRDIIIDGVSSLHGVDHELAVDFSAAVTYAIAALVTESKKGIFIKGLKPEPITSFLRLLDQMGGGYETQDDGIRFYYKEPLVAPQKTLITTDSYVETDKYLSIRTDWQPLISVLLLKAEGTSRVIESIFAQRFQHFDVARQAGAKVDFFDPKQEDPTIQYSFTEDNGLHGVVIHGGEKLQPLTMNAGNDIRLGAFGLLMSLMIPGQSVISDVTQIRRGYDHLIENLQSTGAEIICK